MKAKLGSGARFKSLTKKIVSKGQSPAAAKAIAASIGRKKYGNKRFNKLAQSGRKGK
jgi:hypothetical protein